MTTSQKNWFETFGEEAEAGRQYLSPDIIDFLERVHADHENDFHYYVTGLWAPSEMMDFIFNFLTGPGTYRMPKRKKRHGMVKYLNLYATSINIVSHGNGLV